MQLGLKTSLFICALALTTACGGEKDDKKKKEGNTTTTTSTGNQTGTTCPAAPATTAQSAGGMGDLFGQILSNPNLLADFTKLLGGAFGGGDGGDDGPLGDLLNALKGGTDNMTEIEGILTENEDLANQIKAFLDTLNTDDGGNALLLQQATTTPTTTPCGTGTAAASSATQTGSL